MTWTAPRTWVAGEVPTAAMFNTHLRDNLLYLRSNAVASVATSETTTSLSYTDLATVGPAVTVTTDVQAIVMIFTQMANTTANQWSFASFAVSGATTIAASDPYSLIFVSYTGGGIAAASSSFLVTGLTPGSNTFTMKYKVINNTGTFANRRITVIPC